MALFNFRRETAPQGVTAEVEAFLKGYSIEVMPRTAEKVEDFRAILPKGTRVYIAHIDGTPIEDTIYGCTDIRQFVTVIKADGGATWRGDYLGKVVRYYWSTDGDPIFKAKPHAKTGLRRRRPR